MDEQWDIIILKLLKQIDGLNEQIKQSASRIMELSYEKKILEEKLTSTKVI